MQPRFTMPDKDFSVLLNANAGRVTPRLTQAIRSIIPRGRVHLSQSPEHAQEILHKCVEDNVGTIFAGGGDGTVVGVINELARISGDAPRIPRVGVLRLGTGNALAHWLGSTDPIRDLQRYQGGRIHKSIPMPLVEAEDTLFPFAGLGFDAAVLNDYNWLKNKAKGRWWAPLAKGISGYLMSGYLKTVPNFLTRPNPQVRVVNLGRPVHRIGPDGREIGPAIPTGEVLYEGRCAVLGTGTMPFYGYKMRMFPHALRRAGRFQLRILDISAFGAATHLYPAWKGTLQHPGLHDFYADRVRVSFQDAVPYQLAGEASGYRKEITFQLTETPVEVVGQA